MKRIVALAALATAAPTVPQGNFQHDEAAIVLLTCQRVFGQVTGSAFKVGTSTYITADHVVRGGTCSVGGVPVQITHQDETRDYATFTGPASPAVIRTSCVGFRRGQTYIARGFPGGGSYNITAPWTAIGLALKGFDIFAASDAIPGMSGGPVIDDTGAVVGVVNMKTPARSMALKSTGYCKG